MPQLIGKNRALKLMLLEGRLTIYEESMNGAGWVELHIGNQRFLDMVSDFENKNVKITVEILNDPSEEEE